MLAIIPLFAFTVCREWGGKKDHTRNNLEESIKKRESQKE